MRAPNMSMSTMKVKHSVLASVARRPTAARMRKQVTSVMCRNRCVVRNTKNLGSANRAETSETCCCAEASGRACCWHHGQLCSQASGLRGDAACTGLSMAAQNGRHCGAGFGKCNWKHACAEQYPAAKQQTTLHAA